LDVALALSCAAESVVPYAIAAGVAHVITGVAGVTVREIELVAVPKSVASVGVKVTLRFWEPALRREPAIGVYVKVPGTVNPLEVALALSCAAERVVPYAIAAGVVQAMTGVAGVTVSDVEARAVLKSIVSVGVNVTLRLWKPAGRTVPAAGEYVKVPGTGAPLKVALALSWAAERAVPYAIGPGVGHATEKEAALTVREVDPLTVG
jgi:hypothetical protein